MCFGSNCLENNVTNYLKTKKRIFAKFSTDTKPIDPFKVLKHEINLHKSLKLFNVVRKILRYASQFARR